MTLKQTIRDLQQAIADRATARAEWLRLQGEGSDDQHAARRAHLAKDDLVETLYQQLAETLMASQDGGMTEFDLMNLTPGESDALRRLLSERNMLALAEPARPNNLVEMVDAWRQASFTLDAARALNTLRLSVEADELPQAIEEYDGRIREICEDAWLRAVSTYQALLAQLKSEAEEAGATNVGELDLEGNATHANMRRWLSRYDQLREQLQEMVEGLMDRGSLSFELEELENDARRALVSAIDGGLVRQRQLAPQPKPQSQVQTATETDTDTEVRDSEV